MHLTHVESVFNNSINASTKLAPNELIYGTTVHLFPNFKNSQDNVTVPSVAEYLSQIQDRINEAVAIAKDNRLVVKTIQTRYANQTRREEPIYHVGDKVMLNSQNLRKRLKRTGKSAKFYPRFVGPFRIAKAEPGTSNYTLELPAEYASIHPKFHVKLLKPFVENDPDRFPLREPPRPPPIVPGDNQYEVDRILEHRERRNGRRFLTEYLVRWTGYGEEDDSWVLEDDVNEELVREYKAIVAGEG